MPRMPNKYLREYCRKEELPGYQFDDAGMEGTSVIVHDAETCTAPQDFTLNARRVREALRLLLNTTSRVYPGPPPVGSEGIFENTQDTQPQSKRSNADF